jgi:hypothetical protein
MLYSQKINFGNHVQKALPPQVVICFHHIPLVDQMECLEVVLHLHWARHFHLCPLLHPLVLPLLLQHPHPRLKYLQAVEI